MLTMAIVILLPFYWMLVSSLKDMGEFFNPKPSLFPASATMANYVKLFRETHFVRWLVNSGTVSVLSLALGLVICSLAGFAFAVYEFRGKTLLFWTVLVSVAIPEIVTIIPVFRLMVSARMIDTYSSLVLPYSMNVFGIFLMKQYIASTLPRELLEAARIDGCSEFEIYLRIGLPLARPGLGVLGIYLWLNSWSGYFWPLIMLKSREMMTLPLGLATLYADPWNLQYGMLMAGAFLSTLPIILIFLGAQKQFIAGLTGGALKA
jgi:ABC-type glycerol-3-phosphate transport system permease component